MTYLIIYWTIAACVAGPLIGCVIRACSTPDDYDLGDRLGPYD